MISLPSMCIIIFTLSVYLKLFSTAANTFITPDISQTADDVRDILLCCCDRNMTVHLQLINHAVKTNQVKIWVG